MHALKEIDFRLLLEQLPAIVWATDRDLCFHYARGAGLVALGLGADEVVGLSLSDYLGTRDPDDPTLAAHRAALDGVPAVYELRHEGRVYQVHVEPWRRSEERRVGKECGSGGARANEQQTESGPAATESRDASIRKC